MDIADLEKKLTNLDKELHSIMELVRKANASHDVVDDSAGAWGYEVDGKEFVQKLRRSKRLMNYKTIYRIFLYL